ncbi:MAG: hypothetical protein KAI18_03340 [Candidatus Aenigmarchaeota archaeon]|nr:hypothetical protein [Candidatus Aenigmarchaeota archaeon]
MMRKFCPNCGSETETLIGKVCPDCAGKETVKSTSEIPASIKIMLCECRCVLIKNVWTKYPTLKDVVKSAILRSSKLSKKQKVDIELPSGYPLERKITIPVKVTVYNHDKKESEKEVNVIIIPQCCPVCSRKSGGYYESTVQLRGNNKTVLEIETYIGKRIAETEKDNSDIFITRTEKKSGRIDIYLSSTKFARKLSKEIISKFDIIDHKDSFSHYGIKDGKELKRTTYLLRCN